MARRVIATVLGGCALSAGLALALPAVGWAAAGAPAGPAIARMASDSSSGSRVELAPIYPSDEGSFAEDNRTALMLLLGLVVVGSGAYLVSLAVPRHPSGGAPTPRAV